MRDFATTAVFYTTVMCSLLLCAKNCAGETVTGAEILEPENENDTQALKTQEVHFGKTAILRCHSNDKDHFFLFWKLANGNGVVGPGNEYNDLKYDFEILTGNLIIRETTSNEEGVYECVSKGVRDENIQVRSVRMMVKKEWEDLELHDPGVNYFRGVVIVGFLLVISGVIYYVYKLKKRHRLQSLLEEDEDEEDSAEEIFRAPGTSKETRNIVLERAEEPAEIPKISIDFEDILSESTSSIRK